MCNFLDNLDIKERVSTEVNTQSKKHQKNENRENPTNLIEQKTTY